MCPTVALSAAVLSSLQTEFFSIVFIRQHINTKIFSTYTTTYTTKLNSLRIHFALFFKSVAVFGEKTFFHIG